MDLEKIWLTVLKGRFVLLYVTLITALAGLLLSLFILPKEYRATATLMVGKAYLGQYSSAVLHDDIMLANSLMNSFTEIAVSRSVAETAVKNENLPVDPGVFQRSLSADYLLESQIIYLSASAENPEKAADWANYAAGGFIDFTEELNGLRNVKVIDYALPPGRPVKPDVVDNVARASFLGILASLFIIFLFKKPED